jgi:3-hydroxyacyl-CoA dehydrogenase
MIFLFFDDPPPHHTQSTISKALTASTTPQHHRQGRDNIMTSSIVHSSILPNHPSSNIVVLRFSNPPVNALSRATCAALHEAIIKSKQDLTIQAIILLGGDGLPFSAGADITEFDDSVPVTEDSTRVAPLARLTKEIEDAPIPIIACINKYALGGGLELALACHYRIALPHARLGLPEVKLGLIPGAGGTQRLPRLVGLETALKMIVTGNPIQAKEGKKAGLVDEIAQPSDSATDALLQAAAVFLKQKQNKPAVRRTKDLPVPGLSVTSGSNTNAALELCRAAAKSLSISSVARGGDAQQGCLEAVAAAVTSFSTRKFGEGLAIESRIFARLMQSEQSKALRHVFFVERMTAMSHHSDLVSSNEKMQHVGVVGGGTMGAGIAVAFMDAGVRRVTLVEVKAEALQAAEKVIQGIYASRVRRGLTTVEQAKATVTSCFRGSLALQDLAETDMVVEAVYENMQLKKDIFGKLDSFCHPRTILATNTSTLSIDEIAQATQRPGKVIGMHFFSPAHMMKLVECVKGAATSPESIAAVAKVAKEMKKVCVVVGNCHGFVGNRMLLSYKKELEFLVEEGADPYRVDKLLFEFGFPVGPFVMSDIAGLDVSVRIKKQRKEELLRSGTKVEAERETDISDRFCEELGRMGQKNGKGFYLYDKKVGNGRTPLPDPMVEHWLEKYRKSKGIIPRTDITDKEILERSLFALLNEGFKILQEGMASSAGDIDIVWIYGYGFPAWRGGPMYYAQQQVGLPKLLSGLEEYQRRFPNSPHFRPSGLLRDLVRSLVAKL